MPVCKTNGGVHSDVANEQRAMHTEHEIGSTCLRKVLDTATWQVYGGSQPVIGYKQAKTADVRPVFPLRKFYTEQMFVLLCTKRLQFGQPCRYTNSEALQVVKGL